MNSIMFEDANGDLLTNVIITPEKIITDDNSSVADEDTYEDDVVITRIQLNTNPEATRWVWAVMESWNCDGEEGSDIMLFNNEQSARDVFNDKKKSAKQDKENWGWDMEEDDDPNQYQTWDDGDYNYNHITITMKEMRVD